jgi:peroxiredoxin
MGWVALGARVALAVVFTTAAAAKLADQRGTRRTLADFRVPGPGVAPLALLLPLAELATAVALVAQPTARWGGLAALVLLGVFSAGVGGAMARGEAPDCHCFGQISSAPAGRDTLIRNAVLAIPGAFVLARGPGESIGSWVDGRSPAVLAAVGLGLAAAVAGGAWARQWRALRSLRGELADARDELTLFPPGLPRGTPAPAFELTSATGETTSLESLLRRQRPAALVFMSPSCGGCVFMLPQLRRWQKTLSGRLSIAVVVAGTMEESQQLVDGHALVDVLADERGDVFKRYRVTTTPSAMLLTRDGQVGSRIHSTEPVVEELIRHWLARDARDPLTPHAANGDALSVLQWSSSRR